MPASATPCARPMRWTARCARSRSSRSCWRGWTGTDSRKLNFSGARPERWRRRLLVLAARHPVAAEIVDLAHDRLQRRLPRDILMLAARGQFAFGEQGLERDAAAGD